MTIERKNKGLILANIILLLIVVSLIVYSSSNSKLASSDCVNFGDLGTEFVEFKSVIEHVDTLTEEISYVISESKFGKGDLPIVLPVLNSYNISYIITQDSTLYISKTSYLHCDNILGLSQEISRRLKE